MQGVSDWFCPSTTAPTALFPLPGPSVRCFSRLGLPDRASALGLVKAFLDFDGSEEAWRRYDKVTAREVAIDRGLNGGSKPANAGATSTIVFYVEASRTTLCAVFCPPSVSGMYLYFG